MTTDDAQRGAIPRFDLKCSAYQLKGAGLGFGQGLGTYQLSCKLLAGPDLQSLEEAAASHAPIRLVFSDGDVVLSHLKVQHFPEGWTGIEGRLVAAHSSRT